MAKQKVSFMGQIKEVKSRVLVTGDKGGRMVIEFNLYKDSNLIGRLDNLVKPDEEVRVTIEE